MAVLEDLCKNIDDKGLVGNILMKVKDKMLPIYKFHHILREKLDSSAALFLEGNIFTSNTKTNIADVFIEMRHKFLSYAPFLDLVVNATRAIDLMKLNDNGRNEIKSIDKLLLDNVTKTGQKNLPSTLNALLARPVQHIMR